MEGIVLIGAGGHAVSCIDVIEAEGRFRIAGLIGLDNELHNRVCGYEIIATDRDMRQLASEYRYALITVGQIESSNIREHLFQRAINAGFIFPVIISPQAHVSRHALIGNGSIVMFGAMVNAQAKVGINCIINSHTVVEHCVTVDDHCHISTGAILNGNVSVGRSSFVGSGTLVREGISIGADCLVGMGSVVRHNVPNQMVFLSRGSHG